MKFYGVLLLLLVSTNLFSKTPICEVPSDFKELECAGTFVARDNQSLNNFKETLGKKNNKVKNLVIDFDVTESNLTISTPCNISLKENRELNINGNICLHGDKGVFLRPFTKTRAKNIRLESNEEAVIMHDTEVSADHIEIVSLKNSPLSKSRIGYLAKINAKSIFMESFSRSSVGYSSNIILSEQFSLFSYGEDDAIIGHDTKISAGRIEIALKDALALGKNVSLASGTDLILNASKCNLNARDLILESPNKLGNCFLSSSPKGIFTIDQNSGDAPLDVLFDATKATDALSFFWTFGDGTTLISNNGKVSHNYSTFGNYTATLKYAVGKNAKGQFVYNKSGGAVQIYVKEELNYPPIAYFKYNLDGTYLKLKFDSTSSSGAFKEAYYLIDEVSRIDLNEFYKDTAVTFDLKTFGPHQVELFIKDGHGNASSFKHSIFVNENDDLQLPVANFYWLPSNQREIFFDLTKSFNGKTDSDQIDQFEIDYGDGQIELLGNEFDVNYVKHKYVTAGEYDVTLTVSRGETKNSISKKVVVTDELISALNPMSNFTYHVFDFAGNVSFYDDQSGSPNGEIISYFWEFGDGTTASGKDVVHFYSPGDYFVKLTVVDWIGKRSTQTQHIKIYEAGDTLVSNLECDDPIGFRLNCYAAVLDKEEKINLVRMDWGDQFTQALDSTKKEWGLYDDIFHEYGNAGEFDVSIKASTTDGRESKKSLKISIIDPRPLVTIDCLSLNFRVSCNALASTSLGLLTNYKWDFGNGDSIITTDGHIDYNYTEKGNYIIKVSVYNTLGYFSEAEFGLNLLGVNFFPVAIFNCQVDPEQFSCDANASFDDDGTILSYKWLVDGVEYNGKEITGATTNYKLPVELIVTDDLLSSSKNSIEYLIQNELPVAESKCAISNDEIYCSAEYSNDSDGRIVEYKWTYGDKTILGKTFKLERDVDIPEVLLTVTDNLKGVATDTFVIGEDEENAVHEDEEGYNPSSGKFAFHNVLGKFFWPLETPIEFQLEDVKLNVDRPELSITVNEVKYSDDQFNYDPDSRKLLLNASFKEGKNTISIRALDEDNNEILSEYVFWAGSLTVNFEVSGDSSIAENTIYFSSDINAPIRISNMHFENFPDVPFIFVANNKEDNELGIKFVRKAYSTETISIETEKFEASITKTEFDFSSGLEGVSTTNNAIVDRYTNSIGKNISRLNLYPSRDGVVSFKNTFKASTSLKNLQLAYQLEGAEREDLAIFTIRNKLTSELKIQVVNGSQYADSIISQSISLSNQDDEIEVRGMYIIKEKEDVVFNLIDQYIMSLAYADTSSKFLKVDEPYYTSTLLKDVTLYDYSVVDTSPYSKNKATPIKDLFLNSEFVKEEKTTSNSLGSLYELSIGQYYSGKDAVFYQSILGEKLGTNRFLALLELGSLENGAVTSAVLEICNKHDCSDERYYSKKLALNNELQTIDIPSGSIPFRHEDFYDKKYGEIELKYFVRVCLLKKLEKIECKIVENKNSSRRGGFFRALVPYDGILSNPTSSDLKFGGDFWVDPNVLVQVNSIAPTLSSALKFYEASNSARAPIVRRHDFSKINGNSFYPHKTHHAGTAMDLSFGEFISNDKSPESKFDLQITKASTAFLIDGLLQSSNLYKTVNEIFVGFEDKKKSKNFTPFLTAARFICTDSGKTLYNMIKAEESHRDHLHLTFKDPYEEKVRLSNIDASSFSEPKFQICVNSKGDNIYQFELCDHKSFPSQNTISDLSRVRFFAFDEETKEVEELNVTGAGVDLTKYFENKTFITIRAVYEGDTGRQQKCGYHDILIYKKFKNECPNGEFGIFGTDWSNDYPSLPFPWRGGTGEDLNIYGRVFIGKNANVTKYESRGNDLERDPTNYVCDNAIFQGGSLCGAKITGDAVLSSGNIGVYYSEVTGKVTVKSAQIINNSVVDGDITSEYLSIENSKISKNVTIAVNQISISNSTIKNKTTIQKNNDSGVGIQESTIEGNVFIKDIQSLWGVNINGDIYLDSIPLIYFSNLSGDGYVKNVSITDSTFSGNYNITSCSNDGNQQNYIYKTIFSGTNNSCTYYPLVGEGCRHNDEYSCTDGKCNLICY